MYYRYTSGRNDELLVPSLVFPVDHVEGETNGTYYRTSVIVPLSQDMLTELFTQPKPIPYMMREGGAAENQVQPAVTPKG
jgi:hypothetical protein